MSKYNSILIVDDNRAILTALRYCLENTFEHIITIDNPDNIIMRMSESAFDAVILDMNFSMGVNSGQEGLFWLRAIKKAHPLTPVILLTAYADVNLAVKGLKNGASDFIVKPWDNDELTRKVKDVIEQSTEVETLDAAEASHIRKAVSLCHGNLSKAAEMLGITRQTLYNKMKKMT